jgi:hypothetical protein
MSIGHKRYETYGRLVPHDRILLLAVNLNYRILSEMLLQAHPDGARMSAEDLRQLLDRHGL